MRTNNLLLPFLMLMLFSCSQDDLPIHNLSGSWTLSKYSNIAGEFYCEFEPGDIVWNFGTEGVTLRGRLIAPMELVPCYVVQRNYYELGLDYQITDEGSFTRLTIPDVSFEAMVHQAEKSLVLEVISSPELKPSREGIQVVFDKL